MSTPKYLADARAAVREIEQRAAAMTVEADEIDAHRKPSLHKLETITNRLRKQTVVLSTAGDIKLATMAGLTAQTYGLRELAGKPLSFFVSAVRDSTIKVSGVGYGASYTAKGLVGRVRVPDRAHYLAVQRATAARVRAETALSRARANERGALKDAFDTGSKLTVDQIADGVARHAQVYAALQALPDGSQVRYRRDRLLDSSYGELADAKTHLGHAEAVYKGTAKLEACPCRGCAQDRAKTTELEREAARRAALPRRRVPCPTSGKVHNMPFERARRYLQDPLWPDGPTGWIEQLPIAYCPDNGGHGLILVETFKNDLAFQAKADAKRERVEFTCPNCAEVTVSVVQRDSDDGEAWIECEACEVTLPLASIKARPAPKSKPATEAA